MIGALLHYITREEAIGKSFQPINSNFGILPELGRRIKSKKERAYEHSKRSLAALSEQMNHQGVTIKTDGLLPEPDCLLTVR
jgi:methylenetetrahydrofolate--tRNA-(uracil-5-)-methyltransferase